MNRQRIIASVFSGVAGLLLAASCHSPVSATNEAYMAAAASSPGGGGGAVTSGWSPLGAVWNGGFASPVYGSWSIWGGGDNYSFKGDSTYPSPVDGSAALLMGFAGNTSSGWGGGDYFAENTNSSASNFYYDLSGSGFNAYVFYLKAMAPYGGTNNALTIGFGNGSNPTMFVSNFDVTNGAASPYTVGTYEKVVIPIPNDLNNLRVAVPLYMAEGEASSVWGYNYYLSNIGFVNDTVDTITLNSWALGLNGAKVGAGLPTWNSGSSTASMGFSTIGVGQTLAISDNNNDSVFNYTVVIHSPVTNQNGTTQSATIKGLAAHQISWTCSDPTVATVDSSGNVKGLKAGTVTLTPKINGIQANTNGAANNSGTPETLEIQVIQY